MCRKLSFLVFVVLVLGLVSGAWGDNEVWTNGTGNSNWCTGDNWDDSRPESGDTAYIDQITYSSPDRGPIVFTGCDAEASEIQGPNPASGHTQVVDVNGTGTVEVGSWMWNDGAGTGIVNISDNASVNVKSGKFRGSDNGVSILNISGDPTVVIKECTECDLRGADGSGSFYINMSGGYLECGYDIIFGDNGGGELNVSGGSILVKRLLRLGSLRGSAPVTVNMTAPGGTLRVRGKIELPSNAGRAGNVRINLYAGIIDCNALVHGGADEPPTYTDDWRIDIEEGVLKLKGDVGTAIDVNVANEQITAYDGEGTVVVQIIDGNTVVTGLPPDPHTATNPNPSRKSKNVEPDVVLSWTPGITATSHDVYFGTAFEDVRDGVTSVYQGNQEPNSWDPNVLDPCGLELSTTYYWRIDEKNGGTWAGRVWWFTTRSAIDDPNRRLWYKFDEPNGLVAYDSSGYGHHGAVDGPEDLWLHDGGRDGGARQFDDDGEEVTVIDVPPAVLAEIDDGVTVIVWLKDTYENGDDNWVFGTGTGGEAGAYHVHAAVLSEEGDVLFRAGNDACDVLRGDVSSRAGWHHFAFVKDEAKEEMCMYVDSELVSSKTGVDDTLENIRGCAFKIGTSSWGNYDYEGKMDDFKVFDYGFSATEVAADYRGGDVALAWGPEPGDFEEDVPRHVVLKWKRGDYGDSHDVYLGTDWEDVNEAITVSSEFKGNQDPCEWDPPGNLELDTAYYWRIDEVNDSNGFKWKGNIWQFIVANFLIVDDMESYCMGFGCTNEIYDTWLDGYAENNNTGAEVSLGIKPFEPVHGPKQSMVYVYQNDGGYWGDLDYYSEVEREFSDPCDWTDAGVKALALFFYGQRNNDVNEQMYVGLEDSSGSGSYADVNYGEYGEDVNDIKRAEWHQWDIALSEFTGVDMKSVKKVYIGFGIRGNLSPGGTPGGSGTVYFDDIRLYLPRCVPWRLKPVGDFTDDCRVDIADVAEMAKRWLKRDMSFDEYTNPGTAGLVGWWKLNENGGSTANDSSPSGTHDGTISGDYEWVVGYDSNSAVKFKDARVLVPDAAQLRPAATVSATAWVYYSGDPGGSARVLVKGKNDKEAYAIEVDDQDSATFYVGDVNGGKYRYWADSEDGDTYPDDWLHLAGTYDGNTVKFYIDGEVAGTNDVPKSIPLSQDPCGLAIGNKADVNDNPFKGSIDDVRVYDRALTAAEVAWLASNGTGFVELKLEENLYTGGTPEVINFRDLAKLMESWLEEKLWPPGP